MEMTVRVQQSYDLYCLVEEASGRFMRYRNPAVAHDISIRLSKEPSSVHMLTRDSKELGLDWFGADATVVRPGRRVGTGWEFTLEGNNDHFQVFNFEIERDAREWVSSRFGIQI